MAARPRVLASTTSHKREPLLPTLEVFGRLGLQHLDLNLHHILEEGESVSAVVHAVTTHGLRLWVASGGWCGLGVSQLRLFFGRLEYRDVTPDALDRVCNNLSRLSDAHPDIAFMFENHDGASLHPDICAAILQRVARPNIRLNFDPINFAKGGVDPLAAAGIVGALVGHVHLKGLARGEYCEFGEGDVDLGPVLRSLTEQGYTGSFTVEYEGPFDGTLRLYRSVQRARAALPD